MRVFLKPIYFGPASSGRLLGFLVIGREIDERVAAQIGRVASSRVAFYYGDAIVTSTLTPANLAELMKQKLPGTQNSQPASLDAWKGAFSSHHPGSFAARHSWGPLGGAQIL